MLVTPQEVEYIGKFREDRKDGFGMLATKNEKLFGTWNEDEIVEGFLIKDKNTYYGQFKQQKKHGQGITIWADQTFYYGGFINNKKEGKGVFIGSDQTSKVGNFMNDKPDGEVMILL